MYDDINFVVPAKATSTRVKNKNWRPFFQEKSLVDITIEKMLFAGIPAELIYISCDTNVCLSTCERYQVNWLERKPELCLNDTPITEWIRGTVAQLPMDGKDIAWCQVCDPMFYDYYSCLDLWNAVRGQHDSVSVCYPWKGFLMTEDKQPVGWSFGEHHRISQHLPTFRIMPFTMSVLTRECVKRCGYYVGTRTAWIEASNHLIDIDTEEEFQLAKLFFANHNENRSIHDGWC